MWNAVRPTRSGLPALRRSSGLAVLSDNLAQQARKKLKEQARALAAANRARGDARGWQITSSAGMPTWQFVRGGKFQPIPAR